MAPDTETIHELVMAAGGIPSARGCITAVFEVVLSQCSRKALAAPK